ncbi:MAG: long-chain fatty acid--CoA ligase [Betaproteobacteria bacterium]|jgi:long-chain acyl-CoA synthetase|nr:MAG: long-chain fatty acid--CoA ligase [Betaproteobacteria bacterium]
MQTTDVISSNEAGDLPGLLRCRAARAPQAVAYRQFEESTNSWRAYTWKEIQQEIGRWRTALNAEGLERGNRVAVMLKNSVQWVLFEQAALSLGLVVVPLYSRDAAGNAAFILGNSGSQLVLLGDSQQWQKIVQHRELFPDLATVITLDRAPEAERELDVRYVEDWLPDKMSVQPVHNAPDDLATICYTSGTTGRPKGVMLSHRNILSNAEAIVSTVPAYREDVFLSFLPLSHMLERTGGYYYPMLCGSEVVFARSVETVGEDLQQIRPTVLISVPRMFERAYARIEFALAKKGKLAQRLFKLAEKVGWNRFERLQGRRDKLDLGQRILWPILRIMVVNKILSQLGGRLRMTISGGGRLDEQIAKCFLGFGLPLLQGYGLTESSPCVSSNVEEDNLPDSVGRALPGVKVRLGENNELLVGGPGVMLGYWQRPDATANTFDAEGWLRTGDIAEFVEGRIFIRGRIKDILVTSTGEKVPRADLESAISRDPLFEQVVVVGEAKPYLTALIVVQGEAWKQFASELGLDAESPTTLASIEAKKAVLKRVATLLKEFPSYARVRDTYLTLEPWTVDNGLMTATQKLRHAKILEHFEDVIETLYAGHERRPKAKRENI